MSGTFPLYGTPAARQLDSCATELLGGDGYTLMQRAGLAAWQYLLLHWPHAQSIVVVCGPGNNGGDGYVLAWLARRSGRTVQVVHLPSHSPRSELAQRACTEYVAAGGQVELFRAALPPADIVVDGLFGIGFARAPDAESLALIGAINAQAVPVFSLDVPSGVDAATGAVPGVAVIANRTLQFIARHVGLYTGEALEYTGALDMDALDVPPASFDHVTAFASLLSADALAVWLLPRRRNTHKGESGRVLCIGGDHGSGGAILLCAEAALRSGAGLLSVATREAHVAPLLARRPEAMARAVESDQDLQPLLERTDCIALGPGLGQSEWSRAVFRLAMDAGKPLVIDADGLNLLAAAPRLLHDAVLTPHPGEAARLLGTDTADVQRDRFTAAQAIADRFGAAVVLKGAGTIVAAPEHMPRVIDAGNPGMAVGGMGDVLTGVIAALRGQGLNAFDAASAGALLHSLAGDEAAWDGQRGLLPSDLMPHLRRLANP
ncbi:NAD(P)H-hydrate dehydratase [Pseudoxanthomonas sp. UTMC 1351]|uniref:NAD(P)H-hydrate dehydratase n=1 Tax=Pseudoxanthomonas sp. UTMC 1351 TaxID=2695853 RepID=UPI0034CFDCF3